MFFFSSRRRHTRFDCDWSSDVCSSDLGGVVLTLPLGGHRDSDIQAQFDAAVGGWSAVNGYSGYEPLHYNILRYAAERRDPLVLTPFLGRGDLNVVAYESQPMLIEMVERMPG